MSSVAVAVGLGGVIGGAISSKGQQKAAKTQQKGAIEQTQLTNEMNERLFHESRGSEGHALLPEYFGDFEKNIAGDFQGLYADSAANDFGNNAYRELAPSFGAGNRLVGDVFEGTVADDRLKRVNALIGADRAGSRRIIGADRAGTHGVLSADRTGSQGFIDATRTGGQGVLAADQAGTTGVVGADRAGTAGVVNAQKAGVQRGLSEQLASLRAGRNAGGLGGGSSVATQAALGAAIPAYQTIAGNAAEQERRLALAEATEGRRMGLNEAQEAARIAELQGQEAHRLGLAGASEQARLGMLSATEGRRLDMLAPAERQRLYDQDLQLRLGMLDAPLNRARSAYAFGQMPDEARYQDMDAMLSRLGYANIGPGQPAQARQAPTYAIPNDQMIFGSALSSLAGAAGGMYGAGMFGGGGGGGAAPVAAGGGGVNMSYANANPGTLYQPAPINWGFGG